MTRLIQCPRPGIEPVSLPNRYPGPPNCNATRPNLPSAPPTPRTCQIRWPFLPVPSPPTIRPQEPSGTTSSVLVQWTAEPDDTVDHYNVFYLAEDDFQCEDTDTVNVRQKAREDFCLIVDLEPNTFYVFWVSAVNTAGASPPNDCVTYCTGEGTSTIVCMDVC
ncbi:fibronectin type III and SPRY domain-containing protein 2-like isoform X2 [Petromyzon marinus]|uniref:fibronectin type III and SPRY domain-containing protein 2-like isoform X2 n=1 Tax=Petromyzon marinus TaxID=7757 RepID=UPI003F6EF86B